MRAIFTILLCLLHITLSAQRTEFLLHRADSIKAITGQADEAYLSALSAAIQQAFGEGNNALANKLRSEHAEIIKQKYGEHSVEYAEDIWRLGNVSEHLGRNYQMECYKKAKRIYDALGAKEEFPYSQIMWEFYVDSYNNQKGTIAIHYLKEYLKYCELWLGKEWNGMVMISELMYAHGFLVLGNIYNSTDSYSLSNEAYVKCIDLLESHNLLTQYQYALAPYRGQVVNYIRLNDIRKKVEAQKKVAEVSKNIHGDTSEEYIEELDYLNTCHWENSDLNSIKENIHNILAVIEARDKISGVDFQTDTTYLNYKNEIVSYCVAFQDWHGVVKEGSSLVNIYRQNGMTSSPAYLELLDDLITGYHITGDYLTESSLFTEYETLSEFLGQKESEEYCSYLGLKAEALTFLYRLDEYKLAIEEQTKLKHKLYGELSLQSAHQEVLIANHYVSMDKHNDAYQHILKCYEILESENCKFDDQKDSLIVTSNLHNLEGQIWVTSNPKGAEQALLQAVEEYNLTGQIAFPPLNNLGLLYYSTERNFKKAVEYFIQAKDALEKYGDNYSINYITTLNNIGLCYQNLGLSSYAISIFDLAEQTVEQNYGVSHPMYATLLQNKSMFYGQITDFNSAIVYGEKARDCMASIFGDKSVKYAVCLQNLGLFYIWAGRLTEAKENLLKAIGILENENDMHSIHAYTNLLNIYSHEKDWDTFDKTAKKCFAFVQENNLDNTDLAASLAGTVGYCLLLNGKVKAKDYLGYALDVTRKNGNDNSAEYFGGLVVYYLASFLDGSQNENTISTLIQGYRNLYLSNAAYYNNAERESFVTSPRFASIKDIIFSSRSQGEKDGELYDFLLFNKGLLLGTSLNYAKAIYNSGNEVLISLYGELVEINRFLSGETTLSIEYTMEEAKVRASVLEREITLYLRQNGGYTDELSYTYNDVRQSLSANEMAVEFVSYINYAENCTNYAALVLMKDFEKPAFVKLGKADDIEKLTTLTPDKIYSESPVSQELYDKIWAPIINVAPTVKKIIFSPAGVLNKLAIEQFYNGKKRICESYDLVRVTSTRETCRKSPQYKYASAVLYGGLKYDEDIDTMIAESRSVRGDKSSVSERFRGYTSTTTRKGWDYLPGTLSEVNEVSSIISKGHVSHSLYSAEKGNEESFKALSGNRFDILHIATHGFYMTEIQASRSDYFTSNPFMGNNLNASTSSLYRSGLMMSGGNKAWIGETLPEDIEDGILSAAEISNLDFNSCDIVVLSACETGLGEITDEGVFGLQRSFKIAGVNTIIMSLWEVDDQATSYMMQNFYKNLVKGKNKREAFSIAQAAVKKKYSDPRYWAAFIMLD